MGHVDISLNPYSKGDIVSRFHDGKTTFHMVMRPLDNESVLVVNACFKKPKKNYIQADTSDGVIFITPISGISKIQLSEISLLPMHILFPYDIVSQAYEINNKHNEKLKAQRLIRKAEKQRKREAEKKAKREACAEYAAKAMRYGKTDYAVTNIYKPYQGGGCSGK